jgi:hypothetical protein
MKEYQPKIGRKEKKQVGKFKRFINRVFGSVRRLFTKKRHFYRLKDIEKRVGGGKK